MNSIKLSGQAITSTNYATNRLFNFNPEPIKDMAENFLASGVTEVEIPEGVLDPDNKFPEKGLDKETLKKTIGMLPKETNVIGSYLGSGSLGKDNAAYLVAEKRAIDHLTEYFPQCVYVMLHPPGPDFAEKNTIKKTVATWVELAEYALAKREGFQCCLHNHFDTSCESADQMRTYLEEVKKADHPGLMWGPDTGHCHGMGDEYLDVFGEYASLIGDYFHIKARVPAFDQVHAGELYDADRDVWGGVGAEKGSGLYGGFVNAADPEIHTPFKEVFSLIKNKAKSPKGTVTGAVEIDNPRQHPRLEAMCSVMYFKTTHGLETGQNLSCEEIAQKVFSASSR